MKETMRTFLKATLSPTDVYWCEMCDCDQQFIFIPEERGDRFQPGWNACLSCEECEHVLELWEVAPDDY